MKVIQGLQAIEDWERNAHISLISAQGLAGIEQPDGVCVTWQRKTSLLVSKTDARFRYRQGQFRGMAQGSADRCGGSISSKLSKKLERVKSVDPKLFTSKSNSLRRSGEMCWRKCWGSTLTPRLEKDLRTKAPTCVIGAVNSSIISSLLRSWMNWSRCSTTQTTACVVQRCTHWHATAVRKVLVAPKKERFCRRRLPSWSVIQTPCPRPRHRIGGMSGSHQLRRRGRAFASNEIGFESRGAEEG